MLALLYPSLYAHSSTFWLAFRHGLFPLTFPYLRSWYSLFFLSSFVSTRNHGLQLRVWRQGSSDPVHVLLGHTNRVYSLQVWWLKDRGIAKGEMKKRDCIISSFERIKRPCCAQHLNMHVSHVSLLLCCCSARAIWPALARSTWQYAFGTLSVVSACMCCTVCKLRSLTLCALPLRVVLFAEVIVILTDYCSSSTSLLYLWLCTGHQSLTGLMHLSNGILVSGNSDSTMRVWRVATGE